jgi:phage replication O-like protein O
MPHTKTPQLEDGFTRIANELFEVILGFKFSQRQLVVLLSILRKTYGYGKKEDDMSASQIGELCNISRNHVTETIGQLAKLNVITKRAGKYGLILGVNKEYGTWVRPDDASPESGLVPTQDSPKSGLAVVVPIRDAGSPKSGQVGSPKSGHTKENLSKETKQKKASRPEILFDQWIEATKASGEKPIPEDHAVFKYADKVELPIDFIRLCWLEFKNTFAGNTKKKYADWAQTFSNYVRKNYFRLWFEKDGEWHLTTAGIQLQKEMRHA